MRAANKRANLTVDLVVLLKSTSKALRDRIYDYLVDFTLEDGIDISLKLIEHDKYEEWQRLAEPLIQSVVAEGIEV